MLITCQAPDCHGKKTFSIVAPPVSAERALLDDDGAKMASDTQQLPEDKFRLSKPHTRRVTDHCWMPMNDS